MNKPIPVILAGFGWWATNRTVLPASQGSEPLIRPIAVTSLANGEREYADVGEKFEGLPAPIYCDSLEEAINTKYDTSTQPMAVVINTPNRFHYEQAMAALRAGLHVYIERPAACPNDNLEELIRVARSKDRLLYTGVQRRIEATYSYLHNAVAHNHEFGKLRSIRCYLAVGERLSGWRRKSEMAGGGIILDSGYHLLDAAAWVAQAAGCSVPDNLNGAVMLRNDEADADFDVETTAIGYVGLANDVTLSFDFSYDVPAKCVYERFEVRDEKGNRIVLTRNLPERSTTPANVTHQRADGSLVCADIGSSFQVRMDEASLHGAANNTGPLKSFCDAIACGSTRSVTATCDAEASLNTWRLVRGIYNLASPCGKGE